MSHDEFESQQETPRTGGGGALVAAGVVVACVLGVGLGLWARPGLHEQGDGRMAPAAQPPAEPPKPTERLQVVIDDRPTPVGQPLEVLPADAAGVPAAAVERMPPEPMAPKRPPEGLMKVDAPAASQPLVVLPLPASARMEPPPKAAPEPRREVARTEPPRAKAQPRLAKAEPAAKAARKPERKDTRLAKAERPKHEAAEEPRATSGIRLAAIVRAVRAAPQKIKAEVVAAEHRSARREALAEKDAARKFRAHEEKSRLARAAPVKAPGSKPVLRGEGPLRLAKNTCVSNDPGEALVCADPRLSVRERQLQRAYRDAEAAGVPASELRRQQQRWLAARAAAAREAPWAVDEVYQARIAELNDQSRSGDRY